MRDFFDNPSPQCISETKLIELIAIRTRYLADEIIDSDIPIEQTVDDNERKVTCLLAGMKELLYNHNDPDLRNGDSFAGFTAQVIMFCLLFAHRALCDRSDTPKKKEQIIKEFISKDLSELEIMAANEPVLTIPRPMRK